MTLATIRNFSIVAHIDHGKSTLADRFLALTGTMDAKKAVDQVLDSMDLERERGITIKAHTVRLLYRARDGAEYTLNLIDTPGHVDFSYEVSRALAACEAALLIIDAAQGIEAQTLANYYLALDANLTIVPVINKIDLPAADVEGTRNQITEILDLDGDEALAISAKYGTGVPDVLEAIVARIPPPQGDPEAPLKALVFDSFYDSYQGGVVYVRLTDGRVRPGARILLMSNSRTYDVQQVGVFTPEMRPVDELSAGQVGYLTAPSVRYKVVTTAGEVQEIDNPSKLPTPDRIERLEEPYVRSSIFAPTEFMTAIYKLAQDKRGEHRSLEYVGRGVRIQFDFPLAEIVIDFYDKLKSISRGYASFDYEFANFRPSDLVKLDILLNGDSVDALSIIVHRDKAYEKGKALVEKLRAVIPRQLFEGAIQAAIGSRVIARETVKAMGKNVTAKCYGGDLTRNRKPLGKQKEGKKRMRQGRNGGGPQRAVPPGPKS